MAEGVEILSFQWGMQISHPSLHPSWYGSYPIRLANKRFNEWHYISNETGDSQFNKWPGLGIWAGIQLGISGCEPLWQQYKLQVWHTSNMFDIGNRIVKDLLMHTNWNRNMHKVSDHININLWIKHHLPFLAPPHLGPVVVYGLVRRYFYSGHGQWCNLTFL